MTKKSSKWKTATPTAFKEHTMKNTILDIITAVAIGLLLAVGALAYFDILTK